ncbi:MAG: ATP-binding protein, partial [Verrucomicrobiota bacterium]
MFQDTFDLDIEPSAADKSYTLESLEVCNWGPFKGLHRAEIDPSGTAIIGPTGSGKTTLIDAWMTLLVERPQYNLASTGG